MWGRLEADKKWGADNTKHQSFTKSSEAEAELNREEKYFKVNRSRKAEETAKILKVTISIFYSHFNCIITLRKGQAEANHSRKLPSPYIN